MRVAAQPAKDGLKRPERPEVPWAGPARDKQAVRHDDHDDHDDATNGRETEPHQAAPNAEWVKKALTELKSDSDTMSGDFKLSDETGVKVCVLKSTRKTLHIALRHVVDGKTVFKCIHCFSLQKLKDEDHAAIVAGTFKQICTSNEQLTSCNPCQKKRKEKPDRAKPNDSETNVANLHASSDADGVSETGETDWGEEVPKRTRSDVGPESESGTKRARSEDSAQQPVLVPTQGMFDALSSTVATTGEKVFTLAAELQTLREDIDRTKSDAEIPEWVNDIINALKPEAGEVPASAEYTRARLAEAMKNLMKECERVAKLQRALEGEQKERRALEGELAKANAKTTSDLASLQTVLSARCEEIMEFQRICESKTEELAAVTRVLDHERRELENVTHERDALKALPGNQRERVDKAAQTDELSAGPTALQDAIKAIRSTDLA